MGDVPAAFGDFFSGLVEQRDGPDDAFRLCFGCGPAHPSGLRVRCFETEEGVASPIVVPRVYEGPPGAVHGGIVAAYLDEILGGAAVRATSKIAVTGELTVRYVRPARRRCSGVAVSSQITAATSTSRGVWRNSAPRASWRPRAGDSFRSSRRTARRGPAAS